MLNRLHNCHNRYQRYNKYKRVLCICSAGLLRSPTAAVVLASEPFNFNTRAAGIHDYALIPVDDVLLEWADEIVFMENSHSKLLASQFDIDLISWKKPVVILDIPDNYEYRNEELKAAIADKYREKSANIS